MEDDARLRETLTPQYGNESSFRGRAREFVELHDQVQTSVDLLDSLESFLSTFQKDLSAVSGQISDLQSRSQDIDNRLKSRKRIEKPLSNLLEDIVIEPSLSLLILDSDVGEPWIAAIADFEHLLNIIKARSRVKAAKDLAEVAEGLRIAAATKIRAFFLALIRPIRESMSTNMQVIQTSVLIKYKPLFSFLQRHALNVAQEVQKTYVSAARTYCETGFRRYIRSLGWIKARSPEKSEPITTTVAEKDKEGEYDFDRLSYARIDGPGVTLAYLADDKTYKEPIEALFRSLMLVLMDNSTAEYTFVTTFFATPLAPPESSSGPLSPTSLLSPDSTPFDERRSNAGSDYDEFTPRLGARASVSSKSGIPTSQADAAKEEQASLDATWKQVVDPILDYCQTFVRSTMDPMPPVIPLLTMIRLTEDVVAEVQRRNCPPMESFVFRLRLEMWPVFQKGMTEHVEALKKLAEGATTGFFSRGVATTNAQVTLICHRYITMFTAFVALTEQADETMIFSNLYRLRQELGKLITNHCERITDPKAQATSQSSLCEIVLQGLTRASQSSVHPKCQIEIAHWREKEEQARRRIIAAANRGR